RADRARAARMGPGAGRIPALRDPPPDPAHAIAAPPTPPPVARADGHPRRRGGVEAGAGRLRARLAGPGEPRPFRAGRHAAGSRPRGHRTPTGDAKPMKHAPSRISVVI